MKKALAALVILGSILAAGLADSQTSEFRTIILSGTADTIIDSSLTTSLMAGRRLYVNGVYWFYDNAANTNQIFVDIVRGQSALATSGAGRVFRYSEAMTAAGIKGLALIPNITTGPDSTIYFVISAASSDSIYLAVNCKLVN